MSNHASKGRPAVIWFPEMVEALVAMRTQPRPVNLLRCAARIGVAMSVCRRKAQELGLSSPTYPGPARGSARLPRDALGRWKPGPGRVGATPHPETPVAAPEGPHAGGP